MSNIIEDLQKEIDNLYELYYTMGIRDSVDKQKVLLKIASLKYKIRKQKQKEEDDARQNQRSNQGRD